jgi:L-rhamnose-H+ transport protein
MNSNFLGIMLIAVGSFASAIYYLPLKKLTGWSWETGWIVQGLFAWIIGPWVIAMLTVPHLCEIIGQSPAHSIYVPILFGLGWGIGGLTWGLSIRYLGIGLGNSLPLGITLALSTLIPPFMDGKGGELFSTRTGLFTILGVITALVGIAFCGWAASMKDKELKSDKDATAGFDFKKGIIVALIAGIMSACFAFGEKGGQAMIDIAKQYNPGSIWVNNPVYAIILIGGFVFNMVYCLWLSVKNKSFSDYTKANTPLTSYYIFAAIAGLLWFSQFVFKGMGTNNMSEDMSYVTWCLLFSLVIVFSNVIGIFTGEWKGVSKRAIYTLASGLVVLIVSVLIIGFAKIL